MPFTDDGYEQRSSTDIYEDLRERFQQNHDEDVIPGSLTDKLLQTEADVLADYQEEMAERLYKSAFLTLASGDELTLKALELGIERKTGTAATGVVRFSSGNPVNNDYSIGAGTLVSTGGANPITFETTEQVSLSFIDGFEDGQISEYSLDTADFDAVQTHPYSGSYELTCGATSGSQIYTTSYTVRNGDELHVRVYNEVDTISTFLYGVQDGNNYYEVTVDALNNQVVLSVVDGGTSTTMKSKSVPVPENEYLHLDVDWSVTGDHAVSLDDSSGTEVMSLSATDETFTSGGIGFGSGDTNGAKYWDDVSMSKVAANVQATERGTDTNLPRNAITVMPTPPTGVESVTNPIPTGNRSYTGTGDTRLIVGTDRETDEELRERALDSLSGGGAATAGAIYTAVSNITSVNSLSIFTNETSTDNTGSGGLPPYSTEVVVFGGDATDIVETLYETMSFIDFLRLYGGAHGTEATATITDTTIDRTFTGRISRPTKLSVNVTVDITVRGTSYAGDDAVTKQIVDFVGGTNANNESVIGLGVGEDLYKEELGTEINDVSGVVGISSMTLDTTGDGTDDTTTINGLSAIDVANSEVAQVDVPAGNVTINTTTV